MRLADQGCGGSLGLGGMAAGVSLPNGRLAARPPTDTVAGPWMLLPSLAS